mmetsp:Transcript_1209/g.1590  ORF Transcript_1209/g.1590 Transcript_1209/m.1590 type:complete len:95 (-) Transcript_1209:89-373(-)
MLASVIPEQSTLSLVDLRGNHLSKQAVSILAEAMKRSSRIEHVFVDTEGRIEALAIPNDSNNPNPTSPGRRISRPEAVCVIDCRDNFPPTKQQQ